jgi:hypothetical protein
MLDVRRNDEVKCQIMTFEVNFSIPIEPDNHYTSQHCCYLTDEMKAVYPFGTPGFKLGDTQISLMRDTIGL